MPANTLSTGIDLTLSFTDSNGTQNFMSLESFEESSMATMNEKVQMDGITLFPKFHLGWTGNLTYLRTSDALDRYIALQEAEFRLGIDQRPATITKTVKEANGSLSQYIYGNVVISITNGGRWSGTDVVTQTATWKASTREILA